MSALITKDEKGRMTSEEMTAHTESVAGTLLPIRQNSSDACVSVLLCLIFRDQTI